MKKITFDEITKETIIQLYKDKVSVRKIARMLKVDRSVIQTRLMEWGYNDPKRMNNPKSKKQFNSRQKKKIINLYEDENLSMKDIGIKFNVSGGVIKRNLSIWGIDTKRGCNLNENFFEIIDTEEKAYWLGFISADGWVGIYGNVYRLGIELKDIDVDHLYKFKESIESDCNVHLARRSMASFTVHNEKIVKDLMVLGIVQNKALILKVCSEILPYLLKYYWRGLVDGDGWVITNKNGKPTIGLCGTKEICEGFKSFCQSISPTKANVSKNRGSYQYAVSGSFAIPIIRTLYQDATIYLDRKYEKAMEILGNAGWV